MMDADEREVYIYLKSWTHQFIPPRDICRRAGGKHKYRDNENWAVPALNRMLDRGIVEIQEGHYRLKPMPKPNTKRRMVSPDVARMLKASGKDFSQSVILDNDAEMDAYYESL